MYPIRIQPYLIPVVIVAAGSLIAVAFYFFLGSSDAKKITTNTKVPATIPVPGVQPSDHILGDPDAKVVIIEYSDPECPFCKEQHKTLEKVVKTYPPEEVAWVYRNFPLPQLHSKAPKEAQALLCAGKVGGNDSFWKYTNRLYAITPSNNGLDLVQLPKIARSTGIDVTAFTKCLDSGEMAPRIQKEASDARAAGANGTPYNIFIAGGKQIPLAGMVPFENMKTILDKLLSSSN